MDLIDDLAKNNDTVTDRIHSEVSSFVGYPVYQMVWDLIIKGLHHYRVTTVQALENLSLWQKFRKWKYVPIFTCKQPLQRWIVHLMWV